MAKKTTKQLTPVRLDKLRTEAQAHFQAGELGNAISKQMAAVNGNLDHKDIQDYKFMALYLFAANKFDDTLAVVKGAIEIWPDDLDLIKHLGVCYSRTLQDEKATEWYEKAYALDPDDTNTNDGMAQTYGYLKNREKMLKHGLHSLDLKDKIAAKTKPAVDLSKVPIPPFDPHSPEKNVIAFSLWGKVERYLEGAVRNAEVARHIYPEWRCRFYLDDTVSKAIIARLMAAGADVIKMPKQDSLFEGLFWRFLVANDGSVDRYLIRDADSVLNVRERAAVMEWVSSDKHFHMMRDAHTHTDPILAGMWGGVKGAAPLLDKLLAKYLKSATKTQTIDQQFLFHHLWPIVRGSVMQHDSIYGWHKALPFPEGATLKGKQTVGQNVDGSHVPSPGTLFFEAHGASMTRVPDRQHIIFTLTPGRSGTVFLSQLLKANLKNAEIHHEQVGPNFFGTFSGTAEIFTSFNCRGNVAVVRDFWRKKFASIRQGSTLTYAEISHPLAKCGLLENIHLLGERPEIHIICLHRDAEKVAWSIANRFDFANRSFTWLFALDPSYPRNICSSKLLLPHGMLGASLWYAIEMQARTEYYKILFAKHATVKLHDAELDEITTPGGASELFSKLGQEILPSEVTIPPKANVSTEIFFGDEERALLQRLVKGANFDPEALAMEYIKQGRRIG